MALSASITFGLMQITDERVVAEFVSISMADFRG